MTNQFKSFTPSSYEEWLAKIETDLKGKSLDILLSNPEPDMQIKAYHHAQTAPKKSTSIQRAYNQEDNNWAIRQEFYGENDSKTNSRILHALNEGVNHIGLAIKTNTNLDTLTKEILFEHIETDFSFVDAETAISFNAPNNSHLNYDVIALNAVNGNWKLNIDGFYDFYKKHTDSKSIWVNAYIYGAAGVTSSQELALLASHVNEYVQYLSDKGETLETINDKLVIQLSVNENYFVNIAKFRVARQIIDLVFKGHNENYSPKPVTIYGKTNIRHLAKNDKNNNPLRETTQAMSAIIGGCDVLTVDYGKVGTTDEIDRFERIAKNIQLVLKEEAYMDKVIDPSAGSYYIESISEQLLQNSWEIFLDIEEKEGLIEALKSNHIGNMIETSKSKLIESLNNKKTTFLGVNKYPNGMEDWINVKEESASKETDFKPVIPFYLETAFKKEEA